MGSHTQSRILYSRLEAPCVQGPTQQFKKGATGTGRRYSEEVRQAQELTGGLTLQVCLGPPKSASTWKLSNISGTTKRSPLSGYHALGMKSLVQRGTTTTSHSSPLAAWMVQMVTPSLGPVSPCAGVDPHTLLGC